MSDKDENREENAVVAIIIGFAVVLAIAVSFWAAFGAISMSAKPATATATGPAASAGAASPAMAANAPTLTQLITVAGPAKIYFDTGKNDLPANVAAELAPIIDAVKSGRANKAVVSGFHDKTGSAEVNAEVSRARAQAVAAALASAGLTEGQIDLRKPQETTGNGNDREARRVEVTAVKI